MVSDDLIMQVALRLDAVMAESNLSSVRELADVVGASRSQASNWLNRYHLPPVPYMIVLCEKMGLTLDWIFRGDPAGLSYANAIRLSARLEGEQPRHNIEEPPTPAKKPVAKASKGATKASAKGRSPVKA